MATSHILKGRKKSKPQGYHISHQVQAGASKYPDLLPASIAPAYIQSETSIHSDVLPACVPPTYLCYQAHLELGHTNLLRGSETMAFTSHKE